VVSLSRQLEAEHGRGFSAKNLRHRIHEEIARACAKRGYSGGTPQHLRIVPKGKSVKFEVVVRMKNRIPATSLLANLKQSLGKVMDGPASKRNDALLKSVANLDVPAAGGDRGVNNTLTLAFTTGHNAKSSAAAAWTASSGGWMKSWMTSSPA
jgi:hypothetical protein